MRSYLSLLIDLLLAGCRNPSSVIKQGGVLPLSDAFQVCGLMASAHHEEVVRGLLFFGSISNPDVVKGFVENHQQLKDINTIPAYESLPHHDLILRLKSTLAQAGLTP